MFRERWRDGRFWLWLWRDRVPAEARVGALLVLAVLVLWGGWMAADGLSSANANPGSTKAATAGLGLVDVRTPVKARTRTVTRVRTVVDRRVVTLPGKATTVTVPVTTSIVRNAAPVVHNRIVTVTAPGRTSTDVLTRTKTVTLTETTPPVTYTETVVPPPQTIMVTVTVRH